MEARYSGFFCDVPGFLLGNNQDIPGGTGVTVIRCPEGTVGGGEVRGGAPGSRETDLLRPENTVQNVHAVVLAGGSAFGLAACDGVMKRLKEENIGFETGYGVVPIVPGCVLFDRGVGDADAFPTAEMGYRACRFASNDENSHRMGNIGAGTGCSVGKLHGADRAMKSGLGQASMSKGDLVVSAVVCVNALGDVFDFLRDNEPIAGLLQENMWYDSTVANLQATFCPNLEGRNTTIGVIACNAKLDKASCLKLAQMAQDGYARSIRPVHTPADGDTIFTLAGGEKECDLLTIGVMAQEAMQRAVVNACLCAETAYGLPSYSFLQQNRQ